MKPHRMRMTHNLLLHYDLYKQMEVRLAHAHTPSPPSTPIRASLLATTALNQCCTAAASCTVAAMQPPLPNERRAPGAPARRSHVAALRCVTRRDGSHSHTVSHWVHARVPTLPAAPPLSLPLRPPHLPPSVATGGSRAWTWPHDLGRNTRPDARCLSPSPMITLAAPTTRCGQGFPPRETPSPDSLGWVMRQCASAPYATTAQHTHTHTHTHTHGRG